MPIVKDSVIKLCRATNGILNFPGNLGGLTPTGAEFHIVRADTIGATENHSAGSHGFTDGTDEGCSAWQSEKDLNPTDTSRINSNSAVLIVLGLSSTSAVIQASFSSFGPDEVNINFTVTDGNQWYIKCVMYAGVSCKMGTFNPSATIGTGTTVSGIGFIPRLLKFTGCSSAVNTAFPQTKQSYGVAVLYGGSIKQGCHAQHDRNGQSPTQVYSTTFNNRCFFSILNVGTPDYTLEITTIDSTSSGRFIATTRDVAGTTSEEIYYLAVGADEDEVNIIEMNISSGTGNKAFTGMGFRSDFFMLLGGNCRTFNSQESTAPYAEALCLSHFRKGKLHNLNWTSQDDVSASDTFSRIDNNKAHRTIDGFGAAVFEATLNDFDIDGLEMNYTIADESAVYIGLGFREATSVEGIPNLTGNFNRKFLGGFET